MERRTESGTSKLSSGERILIDTLAALINEGGLSMGYVKSVMGGVRHVARPVHPTRQFRFEDDRSELSDHLRALLNERRPS
jgi:hypothetical protein